MLTFLSTHLVSLIWIALALQGLRFAIDLIQVASIATEETQSPEEEEEEAQPPRRVSQSRTSTEATSMTQNSSNAAESSQLPINTNMYGSTENRNIDRESQPLVGMDNRPSQPSLNTTRARSIFQTICAFVFAILAGICISDNSKGPPSGQLFLSTAAMWVGLDACVSYRDAQRQRYTLITRILRWIATIFFGLAALSARLKYLPLLVVTGSLATVAWDDWYSVRQHRPAESDETENDERSHSTNMSRHTMTTLLKPYFWPDATSNTAFWNRVRAISTWFFLIGSKTCSLTAPLMVGHASTLLAHQDYKSAVHYSMYYAMLTFFGVLFDEAKSVVYLKVAQAAFVQLSEAAFDHLHHLSLDWHLRKKLGEVLRGMDRGIAACDTIMRYLFLWLVPAFGECLVVTIIFASYFQYLPLALSVFCFLFVYIVWTILVTLWRKKFRKALVDSDNGKPMI